MIYKMEGWHCGRCVRGHTVGVLQGFEVDLFKTGPTLCLCKKTPALHLAQLLIKDEKYITAPSKTLLQSRSCSSMGSRMAFLGICGCGTDEWPKGLWRTVHT